MKDDTEQFLTIWRMRPDVALGMDVKINGRRGWVVSVKPWCLDAEIFSKKPKECGCLYITVMWYKYVRRATSDLHIKGCKSHQNHRRGTKVFLRMCDG